MAMAMAGSCNLKSKRLTASVNQTYRLTIPNHRHPVTSYPAPGPRYSAPDSPPTDPQSRRLCVRQYYAINNTPVTPNLSPRYRFCASGAVAVAVARFNASSEDEHQYMYLSYSNHPLQPPDGATMLQISRAIHPGPFNNVYQTRPFQSTEGRK